MEGTPFGRYRLLELLGRGGMGEVWRAHDTSTGRMVAVKLLPPHLAEDKMFQARFRREAYAAAALNEPHVIPIHNFGEIDGRLYVDMRLVEGRDLEAILADGPLDPARAVVIVEQVATALEAAHRIGLIHRDVKPSNVLVAEFDFAYLIDFGIARAADQTALTSTGSTIGTWAYMAPERLSSGQAGPPADIYALACVLYECLTGDRPFAGGVEQQVAGHLTQPPPRPSVARAEVSPSFDAVIAKGMAKDPAERYSSTLELARAARTALDAPAHQLTVPSPDATQLRASTVPDQPASALPVAAEGGSGRRSPRRIGILVTAILATIAVGAGIFAVVKLTNRQEPPAPKPAGPMDGTFTAAFGPRTSIGGDPYTGTLSSAPLEGTWSIRSACPANHCVATATLTNSGNEKSSTFVFDEVGDEWVSVTMRKGKCQNVDTDLWTVFALQRKPDGTLSGEYVEASATECVAKQTVTFTRTGAVDPSVEVADPEAEAPRLVSRAQALRGRYSSTVKYASGPEVKEDVDVLTGCLRSGDRCLSLFHGDNSLQVLVFASGQWTRNSESNVPCQLGGTAHAKVTQYFPLPPVPQDPIALLTGRGHVESTGSACTSDDFDQKFERLGD